MTRSEIAYRYARALFHAALEVRAEQEVFGDVESLLGVASEVPRLRQFLVSPQVPTPDKHALVKSAFDGRAHKLLVELLHLLIDKKRIVYLMEIAEAFRDVYREHQGIAAVKAITAVPLEENQRQRLVRVLEERTRKTVSLTQVVDPDVLGGMILVIDDRVLDGSIRYQLECLKRRLLHTRVLRAGETPADGAR